MKYISKYANGGTSVLPKHDAINPGPEGTKYDIARHEKMKLRNVRYGFFRAGEPQSDPKCSYCGVLVHSKGLLFNGSLLCPNCLSRMNASN